MVKKTVKISVLAVLIVFLFGRDPAMAGVNRTDAESHPRRQAAEMVNPDSFPDVVARVGSENITKATLIERADAIRSQLGIQETSAEFYRKVLDELVGAELIYQAAVGKGMAPSDEELTSQLNALKGQYPNEQEFTNGLTAQGLTLDRLKWMISKDISIGKYIETEVTPRVNVTEEAMRAFYAENSVQMKRPEQAKLSHILIQVQAGAAANVRAQAKTKAEELHARIVAGEDFATLAGEFSDDPGSKTQGGSLSWVSRGQTVPAFEEAAFALMPGEMSGVVETQFGYHIIVLDERRPSQAVPFEEAKPQIVEFLRQQLLQAEMLGEVEVLKTKFKIEILI